MSKAALHTVTNISKGLKGKIEDKDESVEHMYVVVFYRWVESIISGMIEDDNFRDVSIFDIDKEVINGVITPFGVIEVIQTILGEVEEDFLNTRQILITDDHEVEHSYTIHANGDDGLLEPVIYLAFNVRDV